VKLKRRDLELLFVPISILAVVFVAVTLLLIQFRAFEHTYMREARESLSQQAHFISRVLQPDLQRGNIDAVAHYIHVFYGKPFRITVIAANGQVIADSDVKAEEMENHANRPEFQGEDYEQCIERYSETMDKTLLYYAVRLPEGWAIRVSMPMEVLGAAIKDVRYTAASAILLGALLAGVAAFYLFLRVAPHFNRLQAAASAIANGDLSMVIPRPKSGLLRELSAALSAMSQQLKARIQELDRERNEFDTLFNTLREPLLLLSQGGEVLAANRAAERLYGAAIAEGYFRLDPQTIPELEEYVRTAFTAIELHGREISFDDRGVKRFLLARAVRMERRGAMCLLLLLTDLTDVRRLEGFRADFIANVSHEIKTPLTAITSTVETLTDMPLDEAGRTKCLDILSRQARRLNALVADILSLAAIERRQSARKRDFTALHLDAVVKDSVTLCQDDAERAGITLTAATPFPQITFRGDAQLLEQAIINLVTNAIRYSGSPDIVVALTRTAHHAVVTVEDHGCGIEAEHLPRLFERFYRVDRARSRERGGTGLGLAIVKHITLLHRGRVAVKSTPGAGTIFTLTFPL
jgi:two-component system phosphate regulon sensor histidine kinase PhoR